MSNSFLHLIASKHALQGYFDSLRAEVCQSGIKITTISPGYVSTNLSLNALNGDGSLYNKMDETTASGMSPTYVSNIIANSISIGESDVDIADTKTRLVIQLRSMIPSICSFIMSKRASFDVSNKTK